MGILGRILIADDEEVFLDSTADLLREEGYHCDCVGDGPSAAETLAQGEYDLLIADIKMPGNPNLELVKQLEYLADGLPVILVTGYPSMESAIKSVTLPVSAYLVKPVDYEDLMSSVRKAVERARIYRAARDTEYHLKEWQEKLRGMKELLRSHPGNSDSVSVEDFVNITLHNIVISLGDLKNVTEAVASLTGEKDVCHLVNCPRLDTLLAALRDTIGVLERTKSAFKSKELGELRRQLESLVEEAKGHED
jgi:CheY-like chemotaxis protein